VWIGDEPVPGAPEALDALRAAGKGIAFVTNDPRHSPEDYVRKLWRLGFRASLGEVVTVGAALEHLLAGRRRTAFVIGTTAMTAHVEAAGLEVLGDAGRAAHAEVVVVAGHSGFDYGELRTAVQAVLRGAELIGTTRDATFPMPDGPWPGTGPILAAVEAGCGRPADLIVGKPEPAMYRTALDRLGPGRVLAVGDRLDMDIEGARRAGLDCALVLTGGSTAAEARGAAAEPTHVAPSLTHLLLDGA